MTHLCFFRSSPVLSLDISELWPGLIISPQNHHHRIYILLCVKHSPCPAPASSPLKRISILTSAGNSHTQMVFCAIFRRFILRSVYHTNWLSLFLHLCGLLSPFLAQQAWWIILLFLSQSWLSTQSFLRPTTTSSSHRNMRWVTGATKFKVSSPYWFILGCVFVKRGQKRLILPWANLLPVNIWSISS